MVVIGYQFPAMQDFSKYVDSSSILKSVEPAPFWRLHAPFSHLELNLLQFDTLKFIWRKDFDADFKWLQVLL